MITKYTSYYNNIKKRLEVIQEEQGYVNLSLAFGHWFLKNFHMLNDQEIAESLIDGNGDNGIDAIIIKEGYMDFEANKIDPDKSELIILQFKFPENSDKLNREIDQASVLKTLAGFNVLIGRSTNANSNSKFNEFKERLSDKEIYNFQLNYVSFNKGIIDNLETVTSFVKNFEDETGSKMKLNDFNKNSISDIYEKINRQNSISVSMKYTFLQQAYRVNEIDSYIGVVNGKELVNAVKDKLTVIFDENIRLFEPDSKVNEGIKKTASSSEADMFYFYNNGIVFICDDVNNSPNSLTVSLSGSSIVNGCQTVTSLSKLFDEDRLQEDVSILVRIIKISDYDERARITEYLNSQTPIKDSYFISNHTVVRDLQLSLKEHNYYLERQINEVYYKRVFGEPIEDDLIILKLEDVIQYYTAYWIDSLAPLAKRGKGALFNKTHIETVLKDINTEKVITSYTTYQEISKVITMYRKMRRNNTNEEFSLFMEISKQQLEDESEDYLFVNTGDLLLLNTVKMLDQKFSTADNFISTEDLIKNAILICKDVMHEIRESEDRKPAAIMTKNSPTFLKVKEKIITMSSL